MGKFENDFQNNKIEEWKEKYIDYISLKQKIKEYLSDMEMTIGQDPGAFKSY